MDPATPSLGAMGMPPVNHLAIIVAALSSFGLGGLWYGPLFGAAWMRENGLTPEDVKQGSPAKIFGLSLIWALVMAYNLGFFLADPSIGLSQGLMYGFLTGFGWIAMGVFVIRLFERRSAKLMIINGAFMTVSLALMGLIIEAWRLGRPMRRHATLCLGVGGMVPGLIVPALLTAQEAIALPATDRVIRPALERMYVLGADEGDARQSFHRLDHAAFGPDGRLYILDAEGVGVVVVNPRGRITGTLGREGAGPGEFRGPRGLTVLPDGRVLIWDESKRGFVVFGPDGAILPEIRPGVAAGVPDGPFVLRADGSVLAAAARITTRAGFRYLSGEGFSPTATGLPLLRIPVRTGAEVEVAARVRMPAREPGQTLVDLEPTPSWGPLAGGRIALGHDDEYRIEIVAPAGAVERVLTRPLAARAPTAADQRAFARSLEGRTTRTFDGGRGRPLSELPTSMYRVVTPILRLTTDGSRHIWVQRRDAVDPTQPGPVDLLTVTGEYRGTIVNGPGLPVAFGPDGLVAFFGLNNVDAPIVTVYRLPATLR